LYAVVSAACAVAVVPVHGESKDIARQSIRPLCGVPLLAYSIEAALRARLVDQVVVSTGDDEVAAVARAWGAGVLVRQLTAAEAGEDAFQDVVAWLQGHAPQLPDILVELGPASPLRPPDCVDSAIERLLGDQALDAVHGIVPASENPDELCRLRPDGTIAPLVSSNGPDTCRPSGGEPPRVYRRSGHVRAVRTSVVRTRTPISGSRIGALTLDFVYACRLDSEADWTRTEWLLDRFKRPVIRPGTGRPFPPDPRLVVFDFDGVMTDNRVWVGEDGDESVACNRSDGLGLETLRRLGIECFVLSTETRAVVAARCRKLGVPCEHGVRDKSGRLRALLAERGLAPSQVVYVGNDTNDLDCLRLAGCGVAVADAHPDALRVADVRLTRAGGHGAVRELCDRLAAHLSSRPASASSLQR
jgi:N-acylneuraminate cytidylyltransferase